MPVQIICITQYHILVNNNETIICRYRQTMFTEKIQGTNRNVTTDNWFSSVEMADLLLEKGLTMVLVH